MSSVNITHKGLYERVEELMKVVMRLPSKASDAEVEGLIMALPPDTARTVTALTSPRFKDVGMNFMKTMGSWFMEIRQAKEEGKKVILVPFNFPPEVIRIFKKAVPLTCEVTTTLGVAILEGQGERYFEHAMSLGIPDFLCSSSTVELGSILGGSDFRPDAIIQSAVGACDANAKIHEFVSLYMDIPQFILEKPVDSGERGKKQYQKSFMRLMGELSEFIGEELDEEYMRQVVENANLAGDSYNDLYELRKNIPSPVPNLFSLFSYAVRYTSWGTPGAIKFMEEMVALSSQRLENGEYPAPRELARTLWIYTGYYFDLLNFFNWMEENGITYMMDMLDSSFPRYIDTASKETMLEGLAEVGFEYFMTRQMGASSMSAMWIDDVSQVMKDLNANCAVYSGHHSCKQSQSVFSVARNEITKRTGAPVLYLQGDCWIRSMTPISVIKEELEQFVNNVVTKKERRRRTKSKKEV